MPLLFRMVQVLDWIIALSWISRVLVWRRMLRSMLLAIWRGGIVWRGTFYSLHDLRRRAGK